MKFIYSLRKLLVDLPPWLPMILRFILGSFLGSFSLFFVEIHQKMLLFSNLLIPIQGTEFMGYKDMLLKASKLKYSTDNNEINTRT